MEIRELADSVLYRLVRLEAASERWSSARAESEAQARSRRQEYNRDAFDEAIRRLGSEQREIFDDLESLLSAWARLSLLLQPIGGKTEAGKFSTARGKLLRDLLQIEDDSLLLDRDLRNSWMHFDERLDAVIRQTGRWGNRHRFIHSTARDQDNGNSLRIVEVDTLCVTYPDQCGSVKSTSLRMLHPILEEIPERIRQANIEFVVRFPNAND
jgi:hypothetical protein